MKRVRISTAIVGAAILTVGCSQGSSSKGGGGAASPSANAQGTNAAGGTTTAAQSDGGGEAGLSCDPSTYTAAQFPQGWFSGFDGNASDFGFYIAGYGGQNTYTVQDPTVATITSKSVTVPQAMLTQMQTAMQTGNIPAATVTKVMAGFGRARTLYQVTPLKAGFTSVTTSGRSHGENGGFGSTTQQNCLAIASYTSDQLAAGKNRYTNDYDSADPACGSCHLHGKDGAPPHQLGLINEMPDVAAEEWVTTGKMSSNGKSAAKDTNGETQHSWLFKSTDEELGTIAYVRQLSSIDPENLLVLEFAENADHFCLTVNVSPDGSTISSVTQTPNCTPGGFGPGGGGGGGGTTAGTTGSTAATATAASATTGTTTN